MLRQHLPDFALEVLDTFLFICAAMWVTILPSIGVLWIMGVLP